MSSYAGVYVRGFQVTSWRNEVDPAFLFLFTAHDVRHVPMEPENMVYDEQTESILLIANAHVLADRLDVLGIGRELVESMFNEVVHEKLERYKNLRDSVSDLDLDEEINLLEHISLAEWNDLLTAALSSQEKQHSSSFEDPTSLKGLLELWDTVDPRCTLRALLFSCEQDDDLTLDVSALIHAGYMEDDFDPQSDAVNHFNNVLARGSPAVIVTEGSTDSAALEATLRVRYPHLLSYIKFYNFGDGAEGSAAAGVRTLKSFAAAGISNRVVLVLDNDTAARDARRALRGSTLPSHYTVLHYPELELAKEYPALGPNGLDVMNVNGLACSIELYFGTDVLRNDDGSLSPVQWRSFIEGVGAYQGEVIDKKRVQERFRKKVRDAERNPAIRAKQDWSGMEAILDAIIENLRA